MAEIQLELDGEKITTQHGSTILELAIQKNKYIPHFCYHKKLSIAANCRMCLVEVEKMPKPQPACATPIAEGMKIHTASKLAVEAQKGVMEFLLINHPLDCPVCDQGGECQLQDLAVGYGGSESSFTEIKRVVANKDLGSLVATFMTRCIHCSRCVRFTDEIAGYQSLGMSYRSNHVEVMPFVNQVVDMSELSGNIIDLCPVGALVSKPFRHSARAWELSRRKSVSPHDSFGSNLIVQTDKYHKVARVLPFDNEAVNQCWISDRDRFSYIGLNSADRATKPLVRQNNQWIELDWNTAFDYINKSLHMIQQEDGLDCYGSLPIDVLFSANSTVEEICLLDELAKNVKASSMQCDFESFASMNTRKDDHINSCDAFDAKNIFFNPICANIDELEKFKHIVLIGCDIRSESPLFALRIRQMVKNNNAQLYSINIKQDDLLCKVAMQEVVSPYEFVDFSVQTIGQIYAKEELAKNNNNNILVLFGNIAVQHPDFNLLIHRVHHYIYAEQIKQKHNGREDHVDLQQQTNIQDTQCMQANNCNNLAISIRVLSNKANGYFAQYICNKFNQHILNPDISSVSTKQNKHEKDDNLKKYINSEGYILFNLDLEHDSLYAKTMMQKLANAKFVVACTPFVSESIKKYADLILPIAPFTETAGTFINSFGVAQEFNGATKPLEYARPGWKVLCALNNIISNDQSFLYNNIDLLRRGIHPTVQKFFSLNQNAKPEPVYHDDATKPVYHDDIINKIQPDNTTTSNITCAQSKDYKFIVVKIRSIYDVDMITRRSEPLQATELSKNDTMAIISSKYLENNILLPFMSDVDTVSNNANNYVLRFTNSQNDIFKIKCRFSDQIPLGVIIIPTNTLNLSDGMRHKINSLIDNYQIICLAQ